MEPRVAAADIAELDTLEAANRLRSPAGENIRRCVGSSSGGRPRRNRSRLWRRNAFGTEPTRTPAGRSTRRISATSASGNCRCSKSSPATTASKLASSKGRGSSTSPCTGSIPSAAAFSRAAGVDIDPHHRVAGEEVPRQRTRPATEVEDALPGADRRLEQRNALGDEDEVALVTSLPVVLFVTLAERAHAEPTAAPCPSEAIVLRRPSSSAISGSQPRICFARVMSG